MSTNTTCTTPHPLGPLVPTTSLWLFRTVSSTCFPSSASHVQSHAYLTARPSPRSPPPDRPPILMSTISRGVALIAAWKFAKVERLEWSGFGLGGVWAVRTRSRAPIHGNNRRGHRRRHSRYKASASRPQCVWFVAWSRGVGSSYPLVSVSFHFLTLPPLSLLP